MRPTRYAQVVLVASACFFARFAFAEEPAPSTPARIAHSDDFGKDTRQQYETAGPVEWQPGKLILRDGASIGQKLEAGPVVEVTLDLEIPELTEEGQV